MAAGFLAGDLNYAREDQTKEVVRGGKERRKEEGREREGEGKEKHK